jgi:dephospho-CoA kinase
MIRIGITGGIGAGKSTVARIFQTMGFPVYFSDQEAKKIIDSDAGIKEELTALLGPATYLEGKLNRKYVADKLFIDNDLREHVNAIIHPIVRLNFDNWVKLQRTEFVFNEAAILFETGAYKSFDATILVVAPTNMKLDRVMHRDGFSKEEVWSRINNQWPDDKKIPLANYCIYNDEEHPVLRQVEQIVEMLRKQTQFISSKSS